MKERGLLDARVLADEVEMLVEMVVMLANGQVELVKLLVK
jgi:hypothetical protein